MTNEELSELADAALAADVELGRGNKRRCLAVPGRDGICLKCAYENPRAKRGSTAWRNWVGRADRTRSVNYREWRYIEKVRQRLPKDLADLFPSPNEMLLHPQLGYVTVQERLKNFDGSQPMIIKEVLKSVADKALVQRVLDEFARVTKLLADEGVMFFDVGNTTVQMTSPTDFRLRITDIEQNRRFLFWNQEDVMPRFFARRKLMVRRKTHCRDWARKYGLADPLSGKA